MKIKYTLKELKNIVNKKGYRITIEESINDLSFDIMVGCDVLFIRVLDGQIIKIDFDSDEYNTDSNEVARYILNNWIEY